MIKLLVLDMQKQKYVQVVFLVCRAEASVPRVAELNPYVTVKSSVAPIGEGDLSFLTEYQVRISTWHEDIKPRSYT